MATTWVSFRQIKADVAIEQVLGRYGVRLRRTGEELRGPCPLPTHTSRRSRDSFSVSLARNAWSCRSQSCMQARGAPNAPLHFALQYIEGHHPYLATRGLAAETIRTFGIGLYRGRGFLRGRIVIPIHDEYGALIAYAGRAIDGQEPKYPFPTGFRKSLVLFNLHRALKTGVRTVIVFEGYFDALTVHQAGYRAVVALMGSTLSRPQADLLCAHCDRVLIMLDGDAAGRHGATVIVDALTARLRVTHITFDDGCQPDHLSADVIQQLVGEHVHAQPHGPRSTTGVGRESGRGGRPRSRRVSGPQ